MILLTRLISHAKRRWPPMPVPTLLRVGLFDFKSNYVVGLSQDAQDAMVPPIVHQCRAGESTFTSEIVLHRWKRVINRGRTKVCLLP